MNNQLEQLFQKFINSTCTPREFDQLMQLLKQQQHEQQVRSMLRQVYEITGRNLLSETVVDETGNMKPVNDEPVLINQKPKGIRIKKVAGAILVLLMICTGVWFFTEQKTTIKTTPVVALSTVKKFTQRAEQKYLLLPDSTQVWLNVASTLEFPETFEENKRVVYLVGEAYFDVIHADKVPFLVHTNNIVTKVIGTAFNIKAFPDQLDVIVSVKRGKVQVSKNDKVLAVLTKGQQVTVVTKAEQSTATTNNNEVAVWTKGTLKFDSQSFGDITKDLERIYNVTIEINNPAMVQEIITTSFRRDIGVRQALEIICNLTGGKLEEKDNKFTIH